MSETIGSSGLFRCRGLRRLFRCQGREEHCYSYCNWMHCGNLQEDKRTIIIINVGERVYGIK